MNNPLTDLVKKIDNSKDEQKELISTIYSSAKMLGILQCDPDDWLGYSKAANGDDIPKIEKMIEKFKKLLAIKFY